MTHLRSLAALSATSLLLLTACGGSDTEAGGTTTSASSSATTSVAATTASPSPTGPKASDLVADAKKAFDSAPLARFAGSATEKGDTMTMDVTTDAKGNGSGAVSQGKAEGTARVTVIGKTLYISGDKTFWKVNLGDEAARALNGKWISAPAKSKDFAELEDFLDRKSFVDGVFGEVLGGKVTESPDGKTWIVSETDGVLVIDKASKRPLSLKGDAEGEKIDLKFSYPSGSTIQAPPKNKILKMG
ncbi:MAG: hypothetical protein U0Q15_08185 [Kineosporiaceae bacterium]